MSIEFHCTECSKMLRVAAGLGGKRCKCPSCDSVQTVPLQTSLPIATAIPLPKNQTNGSSRETKPAKVDEAVDIKIEIACPKCQSLLLYSPELEGTRGLCKACQHIFTISIHNQEGEQASTFAFQCPKCSFLFEGKKGMEGKKGKCTECKEIFVIEPLKKNSPENREVQPSLRAAKATSQSPQPTAAAAPKLFNPLKPQSAGGATKAIPATPAIPVVPSPTNAESWDLVDVPTPSWSPPASFQSNPYAPPSPLSSTTPRSYGRPLTVSNCLTMVKERIGPILRWSLVPTGIMTGIAIVESVLAVLGLMILGAIGVAVKQSASTDSNFAFGIIIIFGLAIGAILFAIPYFLVLPAYWQIALDGIRGKRLSFDAVQKGVKWSGWLFLCFSMVFLVRFFVNMIVSGAGGLITLEYKDAEIAVRIASMVVSLLVAIITLPVQMLPIALADDLPVGRAIHVSSRYVFGNFWRFIGLSFLAGLMFWGPGILIFILGLLVSYALGAGSAFGAMVAITAIVLASIVTIIFFPGLYACYAAFYVLAKENDR